MEISLGHPTFEDGDAERGVGDRDLVVERAVRRRRLCIAVGDDSAVDASSPLVRLSPENMDRPVGCAWSNCGRPRGGGIRRRRA